MLFKVIKIYVLFCLTYVGSCYAVSNDFGNGDFEVGDTSSWTVTGGTWAGTPAAPLDPAAYTASGGVATITPNGTVDSNIVNYNTITGNSISTSVNGNASLKVNDAISDWGVTVVAQTAANYQYNLISISWLAILQESHEVGNSDHIVIEVKNLNTNITVGSVSYSSASTPDYFTDVGGVYVSGWKTLNVNVTAGYDYAISILAADCPFGGHWGYLYVDFIGHANPEGTPIDEIGKPMIVSAGNFAGGSGINIISSQVNGVSPAYRNIFDGGTLTVDTNGQSYSGNFGITDNGAVIDQYGNFVIFTGVFSDDGVSAGGIRIINSLVGGEVKLTGVNTYTGDTIVDEGANLIISGSGKLGSGNYSGNITVSGALTYEASGDQVINGALDGLGTIKKSGSGNLILDGTSTFGGVTDIDGGSLIVGSSRLKASATLPGEVHINPGGTLAGHGSVGGVNATVRNSGAVSPGNNSIGELKIGGNYTQTEVGNLNIEVSPNSNDKLVVAQNAAIDGALNIYAMSGAYKPTRYTLLTSSTLMGGFNQISNNLSLYTTLKYFYSQDQGNFYLTLGPDYFNTRQQISENLEYLKGGIEDVNSKVKISLDFDCNTFSYRNYCLSTRGDLHETANDVAGVSRRYDSGTASLIGSLRISPFLRVGGWLEKDLSPFSSPVDFRANNPTVGLFSVFSPDGGKSGLQINYSLAYYKNPINITRRSLINTETGSGSTSLQAIGAQVKFGYGLYNVVEDMVVTPYAGLRGFKTLVPSYTERVTSEVQSPISYSEFKSYNNQIFGGLSAEGYLYQNLSYLLNFGLEKDLKNAQSSLNGSSDIYGLSSFSISSSPSLKSRLAFNGKLIYQLGTHEYLSFMASLMFGLNYDFKFSSLGLIYTLGF